MDTSRPRQNSLSEYTSSLHGGKRSSVNRKRRSCNKKCTGEDSDQSKLGTAVSKTLNVEDITLSVSSCIQSLDSSEIRHHDKGTLRNESITEVMPSNEFTQKTPKKLVSAMKGGREKDGKPTLPEKLKVKWAPNVRDPPTTSLSHTVRSHENEQPNSNSKSNNKKHRKRKNKGKSSRGSKNNNDKNQHCKYTTSNSELELSCPDSSQITDDRLFLADRLNKSFEDIVFAQDSKCGSSFLMTSLTSMHISVAEAT